MRPIVGLDLSCLEIEPETGVERYARRLVEHLPHVAPHFDYFIYVRSGRPAPSVRPPAKVVALPSRLPRAAWRETALPRALRAGAVGLLHAPVAAIPLRMNTPRVATIHDVPTFGAPGEDGLLSRNRLRLIHATKTAQRLIVPSDATRRALETAYPDLGPKLRVIPHGVDPDFRPFGLPLRRERYGIPPGPYVLSVGTIRERKDPLVLIGAFRRLLARHDAPSGLHLVLAGDVRMDEAVLRAELRAEGLDSRLVLPGYVAREDLPDLYREAACVVLPSRLEGFGLPALEAMATGRPLIVSNDAALTEVVEAAALRFPNGDALELAHRLHHVFTTPAAAEMLSSKAMERARLFSWEASARAHAELYGEVLATAQRAGG